MPRKPRPENYHDRPKARQARGDGGIYQRKDGLFCAQVSLGYDEHGKRIRPTVYGDTRDEVRTKRDQIKRDHADGKPIAPTKLTVKEHFKDWLRTKKPPATSDVTYKWYRRLAENHIIPGLGRYRLRDLSYREINRFWETLDAKGLEPPSIASIRNVVAMGLNDAVKKNLIASNPLQLAVKRTAGKKEARFLTHDETEAMLLAAQGERLENAWVVDLDSGLRPGELLGLPWSSIDFRRQQINVKQALHEEDGKLYLGPLKTEAAYRIITISEEAIEALKRQRKRQAEEAIEAKNVWRNTDGLVFTDTKGGYLRRTNILRRDLLRVIRRASLIQMAWRLGLDHAELLSLHRQTGSGLIRAGQEILLEGVPYMVDESDVMKGVVIYTFRHTHVSILLAGGLDLKSTAKRIGHEDPAFTLRKYAHAMPGQDEKAAKIMDELHAARRMAVNRQ